MWWFQYVLVYGACTLQKGSRDVQGPASFEVLTQSGRPQQFHSSLQEHFLHQVKNYRCDVHSLSPNIWVASNNWGLLIHITLIYIDVLQFSWIDCIKVRKLSNPSPLPLDLRRADGIGLSNLGSIWMLAGFQVHPVHQHERTSEMYGNGTAQICKVNAE